MTCFSGCFGCLGGRSKKPTPPAVATLPSELQLRTAVKGKLLLFGEVGYEEARLGRKWEVADCKMQKGASERPFSPQSHPTETWNLDAAGWPSAICTVADASDVAACVKFAEATGVELCVAGGRHSHRCMQNNSLVIDLQAMRACSIDVASQTMTCEGGALNGDAHAVMAKHDLGMTLGHHPGTGLGGLVLQGGHGPLEKCFGLSVDALISVEVVLANGTKVMASEKENQDLFWALRGGCGNFGIAVLFCFQLQQMPSYSKLATLQRVHLPLGLGPFPNRFKLVKNFRDHCENGMAHTTSPLLISPCGGPVIELYYHIGEAEEGKGILEPYNKFGKPVDVQAKPRNYFHEISWDILGPRSDDNLADNYYPTSALLAELSDEACQVIADFSGPKSPNSRCSVILNQLGGKAAEVPVEATAVGQRHAKYWLIIQTAWKGRIFSSEDKEREKAVRWARSFREALKPWMSGKYGQLTSVDEPTDCTGSDALSLSSWGPNYSRLQQVKAKYDPDNLFHTNDNIVPAKLDEA
eukprot:TRINITY_DN17217_c0_g1_i1.p1 TRINITY_DN17217_c0_g1~~TRINITY_DN17217_c0_g1_i1.p1  ORF type:complete len:526 (-),score=76.22 TRINITY_DN17217_c0_g1_i1:56-1633(-)